ncbi:MAG: hypothetical protein IPK16_27100, partial [Anaerolineales bacterium]|nr:hypothetical protein [Anaerolineales bacterium]
TPEALARAWGATRGIEAAASGWLEAEPNYTVLAACRANEFAYEYSPDGVTRHGALSFWLHAALRSGGAQVSYAMLHNSVLTKVHGVFSDQTPILQGAGERIFLSDAQASSAVGIAVFPYDGQSHRVRLNAGAAQGLIPGVRFALTPPQPGALPVANVEVTEVEAVHAWATFVGDEPAAKLLEGVRATPAQVTQVTLQKRVVLEALDPAVRAAVMAALDSEAGGFVTLASADDGADFKVGDARAYF